MMRPYLGSWKQLAVQGAAAVVFGLATLVWPHVTLWALVVLWGAYAFVGGIAALSTAIGDKMLVNRGWTAFWGLTGVGAGIVTFLWPSITALALLVVIATWALLGGVSRVAFAVTAGGLPGAWTVALSGVVLVLLGVLLVVNPADGAIGVTWAIGWLAVVFGTVQLRLASVARHEEHEAAERPTIESSQPGHAMV
jgi:uncharacterized membrane protein HdeD (DUF308 family)